MSRFLSCFVVVLFGSACTPKDMIPDDPGHPANPEAPAEVAPAAPADDKAAIAAAETAAYERARPVFAQYCASCHSASGAKKSKDKLEHFDIDAYPFGGEHAETAGKTVREVLGVDGEKATMPADRPGSVKGAELEAIVEWSRAFDRAHEAGLHPARDKGHDHGAQAPAAARKRQVAITVTEKGFGPEKIEVKQGEAVVLTFTRKTDKTCARQVILDLGGGKKVEKELPLDRTVVIEATFDTAGELKYACSMDMFTGVILVQP